MSSPEIALYHDDSGVLIGTVSAEQLQFMIDQLEEEHEADAAYYLDGPTLEFLAERGASPELLAVLRGALAGREQTEIRYTRPGA